MPRRHPADDFSPPRTRQWVIGIAAGLVALAALVVGSYKGTLRGSTFDAHLIAWTSAGALVLSGVFATARVSQCLGRLVSSRSLASAGGAVRILSAAVGYLIVVFGVLAVLDVSVEKLLVGAGLAGIVLGIAATQSLGNVFAGLVIIMARPFSVGDHIRIRSGALGGIFDGWVLEMSLTYTTVRLEDGAWMIPNAAMLAAGVGQLPRVGDVPPLPQVPGAPATSAAPVAPPPPTGPSGPSGPARRVAVADPADPSPAVPSPAAPSPAAPTPETPDQPSAPSPA